MLNKEHIQRHFGCHWDWQEIFMLHFPEWKNSDNINPAKYTDFAWKIFESNGFTFTFERYSNNPKRSLYHAFKEATLWKNGEECFTFGDLAESSALEQMLIHAIGRINFNEFSRETELLRKCQTVGESNISFGL